MNSEIHDGFARTRRASYRFSPVRFRKRDVPIEKSEIRRERERESLINVHRIETKLF